MTNSPEKLLLASLIIDAKKLYLIPEITEHLFYTTKHQYMFAAIAQMVKDDEPVTLTSLELKLGGRVGRSELVDIANTSPTAENIEYWARQVISDYTRREVIRTARQAIADAENRGKDIVETLSSAQKNLDMTLPHKRENSGIYPQIINTVERLIDLPRGGAKNYIPTGFTRLDRQVKLTPGTLTLVAADPGVGKTSYLLCVARHMARRSKRPLIFTLEMTREQILENIVAQELGLCHRDMINGELSNNEIAAFSLNINKFKNLDMGILDGRWTTRQIRHQVVTEMRAGQVDCLMVDALGDIAHDTNVNSKPTHEIYNDDIRDLVMMAVEFKIPVLLSHHLNKHEGRRGKNNRPTRHSLMQAGDKLSHSVILLYREYLETGEVDKKDLAEILVVKARDGEVGTVQVRFDGPTKTFQDIEEHREAPPVMAGGVQWGN